MNNLPHLDEPFVIYALLSSKYQKIIQEKHPHIYRELVSPKEIIYENELQILKDIRRKEEAERKAPPKKKYEIEVTLAGFISSIIIVMPLLFIMLKICAANKILTALSLIANFFFGYFLMIKTSNNNILNKKISFIQSQDKITRAISYLIGLFTSIAYGIYIYPLTINTYYFGLNLSIAIICGLSTSLLTSKLGTKSNAKIDVNAQTHTPSSSFSSWDKQKNLQNNNDGLHLNSSLLHRK